MEKNVEAYLLEGRGALSRQKSQPKGHLVTHVWMNLHSLTAEIKGRKKLPELQAFCRRRFPEMAFCFFN